MRHYLKPFLLIAFVASVIVGMIKLEASDGVEDQKIRVVLNATEASCTAWLSPQSLSHAEGSIQTRGGTIMDSTVDYAYIVNKNGKSIKANYIIHRTNGTLPLYVTKELPISANNSIKLIPLTDGFSAYAARGEKL